MSEPQTIDNTPEHITPGDNAPVAIRRAAMIAKHLGAPAVSDHSEPTKMKEPETPKVEEKVEVKAEEKPKEEVKEPSVEDQRQALMKRERIWSKEKQDLKNELQKYKSFEKEFNELQSKKDRIHKYEELENLSKTNPTQALEKLGITYDRLTQELLNRNTNPKSQADIEIQRLKEETERIRNELKTRDERENKGRHEQMLSNFVRETEDYVSKHLDNFEYVALNNQVGEVVNLRAAAASQRNEIPPVEEAAKIVEDWFENEWQPKIYESKKLQSYFKSKGWKAPDELKPQTKTKPAVADRETRTLSQDLSAGSSPSQATKFRNKDEAIAALKRRYGML